MLDSFNEEQLKMIYHIMDPEHWSLKFKRNKKDIELVKQVVNESKL